MAGYEEVARISATIEANTAPFEQALARGEQRGQAFASKTEAVMERAERSVEDFSRSTASAMARAGAAQTTAAASAQSASSRYVAAQAKMHDANGRVVTGSARTSAAVATHNARMGASFDGLGRKAANFTKLIGASLGIAGGYGFARVVSGVITTGATFDQQMSRVRAVTGSTQAQFDALRGSAIKLGAQSVFSATEAAAGMEILGAAGLSSSQVIAAMPGLLDGAAASGEDFAGTASILTASLGAFNLKAEASGHIMDVLAAAAMASDASIGDIGESLKYAAPVAKSFGMSVEQTAAVLTLFAKAGIKGSQGGTALRASLLQLSDGRGASAKALKAIGIEIEATNGKIKPFSVIVGELGHKFEGMSQKQRLAAASAIFGQEAAAGMLKVISDGQKPLDQLTRGFEKADGAAHKMASTMADNLAGDVEQLKGALESAAIAVSDAFRPQLRDRVQQFQVYVNSDEFVDDAQAIVGAVVNIGEAMADTAAFVYRHKDAIIALTAAYVGLRMASAGASLIGGLAGARGGRAGIAGLAATAGEAAVTAGPKLLTFARIAGTAARGMTAIGLGTIAAQALWSLAHSGDDAASSAEGARSRIASLRQELDDIPSRKITEVVVKTKHVDGDGKPKAPKRPKDPTGGLSEGVDIDASNADVFRGIAHEHEAAVDRVTAAYKRQREAREDADNADARVQAARYNREQRFQEFVDGGLSEMQAADHPEIEGLDRQLKGLEKAADDARDKVAKTNDEVAKSKSVASEAGKALEEAYRKLAGVGKNAKAGDVEKMLGGWSKEKLIQKLGVSDINAAMKRLGFVKISGNWYDSFAQYNKLVKAAANGTPKDVNRLLKLIGATDTSGQARAAFLADVRAMRAEAARDIVIDTYLRTHRQTINDSSRQSGTYMPTRASGGLVTGPGSGTSDDIVARISNGEYVVRAAMVDKYGESFLDALNQGTLPAFAGGGRVKPSQALKRATAQAAIDADPTKTLRQAEAQYNAALAALKKIQAGGVTKAEKQKAADAKSLLDDRARALVDARRGVQDAKAQKLADAQRALTERTDLAFSDEDATNRQGALSARGTVGLSDDIANVDAQRGTNARRIEALRKDVAAAKNEETRRALTEKLNSAIEQQISLDNERTSLIDQQNAAVREAELDKPRSAMAMIDAVRDLEMAKAEGTADTSDDKAVRERALADERQRQSLIEAVLSRGDLTEEERAAKTRDLAASVRNVNQLTQALEQSATPTESQQFMDSAFSGSGGGGSGGIDSANITRSGGGGSGVGYVPDPDSHPVFFDTNQINTLTFDSAGGVGVKIMQINGWDEGEDQRIATEDRAGQDGEHAREMLLGGSTIKIRGIIAGSSISDLWARRKALKRALQPTRDELVLKMPDPTYGGAIATTYAASMTGYQRKSCRVIEGVTWGERHGRFGHYFEVTLRASDPRRYSDVVTTVLTGAISTGGGMASPMSSPLSSSGSGTGGTASFTNDGDYDTPMILRVRANGSTIVNPIIEGSDWQIVFDGLTIGTVDYLEIDPVERTAFLNGDENANRFQYVDYSQTTWGLLSEDANTVRLRGSSISDPSYLEIEYRPASL